MIRDLRLKSWHFSFSFFFFFDRLQFGDSVAIRFSSRGSNARLFGWLQRSGPPVDVENIRRKRARASHVRYRNHRRPRLERAHQLQGRLQRKPRRRPVVLEGK